MNGSYSTALWLEFNGFHLVYFFQDEKHLAVGGAGRAVQDFGLAGKVEKRQAETVVQQFFLVVNLLLILFPGFPVRRICEHKSEGLVGEMVFRNGVAQMDAGGVNAFDDSVGLADGVGLGVDFRSRELDGVGIDAQAKEVFPAFGKHAA